MSVQWGDSRCVAVFNLNGQLLRCERHTHKRGRHRGNLGVVAESHTGAPMFYSRVRLRWSNWRVRPPS